MPVYGANASHDRFGFGIVEMPTVPSQKIVDTMHGGYGKMKSIVQGFGRKCPSLKKRIRQLNYDLGNRQYGNTG